MKLYLIRHGQTRWNIEGKIQGKTDIPLNETGLLQAQCLAEAMESCAISSVYCSVLKRARQTAEILVSGARAAGRSLPLYPMEELREVDFGLWEGKTWEEIRQAYPEDYAGWEKNPTAVTPTGGERREDCRVRTRAAVERILNEAGGDAAIVAHGGILVYVIDYLLRNQTKKQEIIVRNASISVIEYDQKTELGRLLVLNDTAHLAPVAGEITNKYC